MNLSKYLLFLILFLIFTHHMYAQNNPGYDSLWKKTDQLISKQGLTRSALAEVDKIYAKAKKEKQDAQVVKALVYKMQLQDKVEEADNESLSMLHREIKAAAEPVKSILNSFLAGKYLQYFREHRYKLYNRTTTIHFTQNDVATWGIDDFHKKIGELYLASTSEKKILQHTSLAAFDPIIAKGNVRYLRPTLYDLLANEALQYFVSDERDIHKAASSFEIKDPALFSDASIFSSMKLETSDSTSLQHKALQLYQGLLIFHASDAKPDAFIDADINRLSFVYQYGVMENKEELLITALRKITEKYAAIPAAAQAWYLIAERYAEKAAGYHPLNDTTNRYAYMEAVKICEQVLQQRDSSEGKTNCSNLLKQITRREIGLVTESVNLPDVPFRTLVEYRNAARLFIRIIPLTETYRKAQERYSDAYWNRLVTLKPLREWSQPLPATGDYQKHSTEIKVDALPAGSYMMLTSLEETFSTTKNYLAVQDFLVSNISFIRKNRDFFLLHRASGKPLQKASLALIYNIYKPEKRTNDTARTPAILSDENGFVRLTSFPTGASAQQVEIRYNGERIVLDDQQWIAGSRSNQETETAAATYEENNARLFLFTDRSIYRPGQTVYFKGIVITRDFATKKSKLLAAHRAKIYLYDANNEAVDSVDVSTNQFGSYSGKFTLPRQALNGQFRIADDSLDGEQRFSVEEYKRPRFYVDYDTIKEALRVNDMVNITGYARAYAGNNVDGAQVTYRVLRRPRFVYTWHFRSGYPPASPLEVTHGVATTDATGRFTIHFKAIPDMTISKEQDPVFDYQVIADVTDLNGETRSGETTIPVSYKALQVTINDPVMDAVVPSDSLLSLSVTTQNILGQFQSSPVHLTIYRLVAPDRLVRKRYWDQPDQFVMNRSEFLQDFPSDEYQTEADYHTWTKGDKVWETSDTTQEKKRIPINRLALGQGSYMIEAIAKDKWGQEVKDVRYVQVYELKDKLLPAPHYSWSTQQNPVIEPGETSVITIGSSASDLYVVQEVNHDRQIPDADDERDSSTGRYTFFRLDHERKSFPFTATEQDRGGFGVQYLFVKDNRFYAVSNMVAVPWTNKQLTVSYTTLREKTLPGSQEKWKIKISGYKGEQAASEILASMYDASLDQFRPHVWNTPAVLPFYSPTKWAGFSNFGSIRSREKYIPENFQEVVKQYDELISVGSSDLRTRLSGMVSGLQPIGASPLSIRLSGLAAEPSNALNEVVMVAYGTGRKKDAAGAVQSASPDGGNAPSPHPRTNFNETAFFFPDLHTDKDGNIEFSFTMPEALTRWKFQALAHTADLAFGYSTRDIVTQKQLMVQPNAPRFLREGDHIDLSTKIVNMTARELTGTVHLELFDAATMKPVDGWFQNMTANQYFTVEAGKSVPAIFTVQVPYQFNSAIVYRFTASSAAGKDTVSDGEEASIPVLKNSILVTESVPLPMRGNGAKNFTFDKLLKSGSSETLQQYALSVEYTGNPVWYAVQSLPYLADYPYECAEQTFNRFYANALAARIARTSPRLKAVFDKWNTPQTAPDSAALLSNLQKNEELKSVLLEETPWVLQAKTEAEQKKNIALLFDMTRMSGELDATLRKLQQYQLPGGGFPWFRGDNRDDRYITQYILTGIGHLKKLGAWPSHDSALLAALVTPAVRYLDQRIKEDYEVVLKSKNVAGSNAGLQPIQAQYLYMRSFFPDLDVAGTSFNAVNFFRKQAQQQWLQQGRYQQGMIALALYRTGDVKTAQDILKSLQQNAIRSEELGMYWKEVRSGYYWYQAPVETQSLLIEAFSEIGRNDQVVTDLSTWLLQQKQTQHWSTTKATADACYALLIGSYAPGQSPLTTPDNEPVVEIRLGDKTVKSTDQPAQAGTGYFKKTFDAQFVNANMGNISVKVQHAGNARPLPSWGAVYWQYFENLDQITSSATALKLDKKLFIETNSDRGPVLQPLVDGTVLHPGTKIRVRIELRSDRDLEYVHMKDMRGSCMEPVNVLSSFKWQGGLGYYESTRDASTSFFFSRLPKGTFVFEYPMFVTHTGTFSNGITTIQCMYAPEFTSHSEGVKVTVE